MKGTMRNLEDGRHYVLRNKKTTIGKDGNDINILGVQIEGNHAVVEYDEKNDCFFVKDLNTSHGTYVNDCRVHDSVVRLTHGDIVRFGHGGPRFDVLFNMQNQNNPPVITQQAWDDSYIPATAKSLPYLPLQSSTTASITKPYSTISYGRVNGYHGHNKPTEVGSSIVPRPPTRQRPVSANPNNNESFQTTALQRPLSASFNRDYTAYSGVKTSDQVMELESRLLEMHEELNRLGSYENECYKKDGIINTLRDEVEQLHQLLGEYDRNRGLTDEQRSRLASLQSQLTFKDDEVRRLQDENRKLKNDRLSHDRSTDQLADMKTHLTRHERKIIAMENEVKKSNQEKSQLSMLVNTLQKEVAAKDVLLRKSKTITEKHKAEMRQKDAELNSMSSRIASHEALAKNERELKKKDEEIGNLRYRLRQSEEQFKKKLSDFQMIEDSLSQSSLAYSETEQMNNRLQKELQIYQSRCQQLENEEQQMRIDFQNLKRKYEKFHQSVAEFIGREGKKISSVLDDDDVLNYIHELKDQRDDSQDRLESVLTEKIDLEKRISSYKSFDHLQNLFAGMESRLKNNGRSCQNIDRELRNIQDCDIPDQLNWIKDFISTMLSQEYNWERQIEDALKSMLEDSDHNMIEPALLIHRLQDKLKLNLEKINDLEIKINSAEYEHNQLYKEMKDSIKDKYKKKTEKLIKEVKYEEERKHRDEINDLLDQEREKLSAALQAQKDLYDTDIGSVSELSKKIESLKMQHHKAREEFQKLHRELEESRQNEVALKMKVKEQDMAYEIKEEMLENKLRDKEDKESMAYKSQLRQCERTISSLESTVLDINKEKKDLEYQLIELRKAVKDERSGKDKLKKQETKAVHKLKKEIEELHATIEKLRSSLTATEEERDEQKKISQSLQNDLNGLSAKITDLKAELCDKEKQKLETMAHRSEKLENEVKEYRKQLLQMSQLVEDQKAKLIEQDKKIVLQNNTLAYQADGLRENGQGEEKLVEKKKVKFTPGIPVTELMGIGEQCVTQRHEQIIAKQRAALSDLRGAVNKLEHHSPVSASQHLALQEISSLKKENLVLRTKLSMKDEFKTDEELFRQEKDTSQDVDVKYQLCETKEMFECAVHDYQVEKKSHQTTQEALHDSEELYLRLIRLVSSEFDIKDVLGCQPMGYVENDERKRIVKDRNKAVDVIMKRLNLMQNRIERKDQMLESYDDDLKSLRKSEKIAGNKNKEIKNLELELQQHKDEITYLREALKKCRTELDKQTRLNTAYKQKKVFLMDYKEESEPKKHSCYVDEFKKFKAKYDVLQEKGTSRDVDVTNQEEQKMKKSKEIIQKKTFEIKDLKLELAKADQELDDANIKLKEYQHKKDNRKFVDSSFLFSKDRDELEDLEG